MRYILPHIPVLAIGLIFATIPGHLVASDAADVFPTAADAEFFSGIFVEQQTGCMAISDIKSSLSEVLTPREESKFMIVTVVISPALDKTLAVLRAIERKTGEILLEKTLRITPEECADAHLVLKVMLEQFLTGFPIEKWKEKQVATTWVSAPIQGRHKVVIEKKIGTLHGILLFGIDSRWPTPGGDLELCLGVDAGGKRHGIFGLTVLRAGWPRPLGEGRYLETSAQLALGWRFSPNSTLAVRTEIRTGALLVSGVGYEKNYRKWLVTVEGQLSLLWAFGPLYLGPEIAVSPLFYTVYTESGEQEDLAWIRVGLLLLVPFGETALK